MVFADKLNYLFELSHAEGKELAAEMNVTPPQISKMRRGVRGLPKDRASARMIARFFAQRCGSDFQRDALSQALKVAHVKNLEGESAFTEFLLDWLSDEQDPDDYAANRADGFLRQFGAVFGMGDGETEGGYSRELGSGHNSFFAYYGSEGKRLAVDTFLSYLAQLKKPFTIDILTDESVSWVVEDPNYSRRLQGEMLRLTELGCIFRRISGPISDMDEAFEALNRWLPLYITGKATSYYYKRMRDNLNRITLFVVPDTAVMFSFSVGGAPNKGAVTFFTVDEKTVNALAAEFEKYLVMCEPIMNVYSPQKSLKKMHACMLEYESCSAACIQRSNSLSFITLPSDVAMSLKADDPGEEKSEFLASFAQRYKRFGENLKHYPFVDIIRLADAQTIANAAAPVPAAYVLCSEPQHYEPTGYLQHLRSILYLLEHRENYHVVLRRPDDDDSTIVYVKEGNCAILARNFSPFSVFEVTERYLVDAFTEYLRRLVPGLQNEKANKRAVIAEIKARIKEVEALLSASGDH